MGDGAGPILEYGGLVYATHRDVYDPHDDTWLLVDQVQGLDVAGKRVLEVGCGTGLALLAAVMQGARGVGSDRNPVAVRLLLHNAALNGLPGRVQGVVGDLVSPFDPEAIDLILFNPPYLPTSPAERVQGPLNDAFDGGPGGDETIGRFLRGLEAWAHHGLRVPEVMLVLSNLNDAARVRRRMSSIGLDRARRCAPRRSFFHRLWVERFSRGGSTQ